MRFISWIPSGVTSQSKSPVKQIVRRIGHTRRYEPMPAGLKAMTALFVLRNKVIKPLLAVAQKPRPARGTQNPSALDTHYYAIDSLCRESFRNWGWPRKHQQ